MSNPTNSTQTIVQIASSNPSFSTLVAAIKAADLVEALSGDNQITVFAPTNEAFAKLPEGVLEELLKPENKEDLVEILTNHVVNEVVTSTQIVELDSVETLAGEVEVSVEGGKVMLDDATVTQADIMATNGVIHVIDSVLLPDDFDLEEEE